MNLSKTEQKFLVHWGEMGTKWGINRSVAQIHALLYLAERPLPADEIVTTLGIARSNVSTGIKELQSWRLVNVSHQLGDRRDHFSTSKDVWELFRIILQERKRREVDPTVGVLRECVQELNAKPDQQDEISHSRLSNMLEFMELAESWGQRAANLSPQSLKRLSTLGDKIFKLVS